MKNNVYHNYLKDLGSLLKEIIEEHKAKKLVDKMSDYDTGYEMALYELVSLMQNQAEVFEIDLSEINLSGIDPEKDLLTFGNEGK